MYILRIIARLDIKGPNLIKGINFEGLKVVGDPNKFALDYYKDGADEIIFMDIVASLYNRNSLHDIIKSTCKNIFIPITVGGGIRTIDDALKIFDSGADKISVNTRAVQNPDLISVLSKRFGSQSIVLSVEAKKVAEKKWEPYIESGREKTNLDVIEWVKKGSDLGAGEILLTSVDMEGTCKGFDTELIYEVSKNVSIPIIASGGFGEKKDLEKAHKAGADSIAIGHMLHYNKLNLRQIRDYALNASIKVRKYAQ